MLFPSAAFDSYSLETWQLVHHNTTQWDRVRELTLLHLLAHWYEEGHWLKASDSTVAPGEFKPRPEVDTVVPFSHRGLSPALRKFGV